MATPKKTTAKRATRTKQASVPSGHITFLVAFFTLLSIVFAVMAYWRYSA
jgi:hypothetical protein